MRYVILAYLVASILVPDVAQAYIGPGSGVSAFGSLFAVLSAIFFGLVGFVWYPVKRLLRFFRSHFRSGSE